MINLLNLTAHAININSNGGDDVVVVLPSGHVARLVGSAPEALPSIRLGDGLGLVTVTSPLSYERAEGLYFTPDGRGLLVSALVGAYLADNPEQARGRAVYSPGPLVRNESGQPIGCQGLVCWVAEARDVCLYCGHDNGPVFNSTRHSFDCAWCGSN